MLKVDLQSFDGNPSNYRNFIRLFEAYVAAESDPKAKLTKLLQYTTAKLAIQCCAIMEPTEMLEETNEY